MTEAEWLNCRDPRLLLIFLEGKASDRKARLYSCGLGRALLPFLGDERSRRVVGVAERYADDNATGIELTLAREAASIARRGEASQAVRWVGDKGPWQGARVIVLSIQDAQAQVDAKDWSGRLDGLSRRLLRCVFGNPFRGVMIAERCLTWNDGAIRKTAQAIYDDWAFDRLPLLADALEDAGCTDAAILSHCREPGEHLRGCWVVDLILGKN